MLAAVAVAMSPGHASAAKPHGYLDKATTAQIGGWARDPDHTGPIMVHIYIDGKLAHDMLANGLRTDLPYKDQKHGFAWVPPPLGPGSHKIIVYGIGVDAAGKIDGVNWGLTNSPSVISAGCAGMTHATGTWCKYVAGYYKTRAADTLYLYNENMRAGVNKSYGGAIMEFYGKDHNRNLLTEHGGAAMQLSIWGYDKKGTAAWFGQGSGVCDPTAYATQSACQKKNASCRLWGWSKGDHVTNCASVKSCVDWGAGAPFNPIQAQAINCGWESTTNDVTVAKTSTNQVYVSKVAPYHFTQNNAMPGLTWHQTAVLYKAYLRVTYRITYSGPYTLSTHPQEIPALFPGSGLNHTYYLYTGSAPYTSAAVKTITKPKAGLMLRLKGRTPFPHGTVDHYLTENWISVCDASGKHCLTVALFSPQYREIAGAGYPGNGYGYLTSLGGFNIRPGMDETFSVYLFAGRYNSTISGKTVRKWIYDLAAASKCLAHGYPCDDGNVCTTADACDGKGKCVGKPTAGCPKKDAGPNKDLGGQADKGSLKDKGSANPEASAPADSKTQPETGQADVAGVSDQGQAGDRGTLESGASGPGPSNGIESGCACRLSSSPGEPDALPLFALLLLGIWRRCRQHDRAG